MSHGTSVITGDLQTTVAGIFGPSVQISGLSGQPVDHNQLAEFYKHGGTHATTGVRTPSLSGVCRGAGVSNWTVLYRYHTRSTARPELCRRT
jgi:hypothetical protein